MEVPRVLGIFLEIFSEIQNKIINGSGGWENLIAPDCLEYFFS
jgi:hypothetical protein